MQPFGGEGLSGTGPKAGGPLYLYRLLSSRPQNAVGPPFAPPGCGTSAGCAAENPAGKTAERAAAVGLGRLELQALCQQYRDGTKAGNPTSAAGPTGERNTLTFIPRDRVLYVADNEQDTLIQLAAVTTGRL